MSLISRFIILVFLLLLTGCNERELTFDRTYPDTSHLAELQENKQLELKEKMKNLPDYLTKNNVRPREMNVSIPNRGDYI